MWVSTLPDLLVSPLITICAVTAPVRPAGVAEEENVSASLPTTFTLEKAKGCPRPPDPDDAVAENLMNEPALTKPNPVAAQLPSRQPTERGPVVWSPEPSLI